MSSAVLEGIGCCVADAVEAQKGGASRLEVVRELDRGGLTPSIQLVQAIKDAVDLPLRVMVRESDGYGTRNDNFGARDDGYETRNDNFGARDDGCGVRNEAEVERLCVATREFAKLRVDGLVLGFLKNDQIDLDLTARVLACAPEIHATFHQDRKSTRLKSRHVSESR